MKTLVRFLVLLPLLWFCSCTTSSKTTAEGPLERFEFTRPQMGLPFRMVLYAASAASAEAAADAAYNRIRELNDSLSDYDAGSEISRLSRSSGQGRKVAVSEDLWRVLVRSQALAQETGGAFDVTVGPTVNFWRKARREKRMPDPVRLQEARRAIGYQKVRLHPERHTVELLVPNMRLDLGAIAKGYAMDEALRILRGHGIHRALVTGGGDMAMWDPPPGKEGWTIELAPLDVPHAPSRRFVQLRRAALATSGDYFQNLEIDGVRYSHILDPRTGLGLTDRKLVVVIARDCITADSLSTAVSVLSSREGLKLIDHTRGAECRVVRRPDTGLEVYESAGFKRYYTRNQSSEVTP